MKRVTDSVTRMGVGTANRYLLETPEALALIDTGFPNSADRILAATKRLGHAPDALAHIVLTHASGPYQQRGRARARKRRADMDASRGRADRRACRSGPSPSASDARIIAKTAVHHDEPDAAEGRTRAHWPPHLSTSFAPCDL